MTFKSKMEFCLYLSGLLTFSCSSNTCNIHLEVFKLSLYPCLVEMNIYDIKTSRSRQQCAARCLGNQFGQCSTFIWNPSDSVCRLHSENDLLLGSNVTVLADWLIYHKIFTGCNYEGYIYNSKSNACLKVYTKGDTWTSARLQCQQDGGDLFTITTTEKRDFISHFASCKQRLFIGLWNGTWVNGEPFENIFGPKTLLNNDDLDFSNDNDKTCGTFVNISPPETWVLDDSCNIRKRPFVCEISV